MDSEIKKSPNIINNYIFDKLKKTDTYRCNGDCSCTNFIRTPFDLEQIRKFDRTYTPSNIYTFK